MRTFIHEPELSGGEINSLDIYAKPKKKNKTNKKSIANLVCQN